MDFKKLIKEVERLLVQKNDKDFEKLQGIKQTVEVVESDLDAKALMRGNIDWQKLKKLLELKDGGAKG